MGHRPFCTASARIITTIGMTIIQRTRLGVNRTRILRVRPNFSNLITRSADASMKYKMIVLDIDGTIRSNDYAISQSTRRAVEDARNAGAVVTIATGRMFRSAIHVATDLNLVSPVVTYQGAHIADPVSSEILWHRPLSPRMVDDALDAIDIQDHEVLAQSRDRVYVQRWTSWVEAYAKRNVVEVRVVDDLRVLAQDGITRLIVGGEDDGVEQATQTLTHSLGAELLITRPLPYFCEVLHPDAGKERALKRLCGILGLPAEAAVVFGNGDEDAPMIAWAGLGVAMGDGSRAAMAASDEVAPPLADDGVAHVIQRLLRGGSFG